MRRLLIRPGAIGDFIVSLPALESLRAEFTEVWAAPANVPLARFADRARSLQETGLNWLEIQGADSPPRLLEALRSFDSIISWYGTARPEFREAAAGLRLPIEFLPALPSEGGIHAADFYLEQARRLGGVVVDPVPLIRCPRETGGHVVIHPFSGSPSKNWPFPSFEAVARRLEERFPVDWLAGPDEDLPGARRFDDLYELACWLAGARLYIGNDSGVSHLAAASGAPAVVVFCPTGERVWAPRGSCVRIVRSGEPGASLSSIPAGAVLREAEALLAVRAPATR